MTQVRASQPSTAPSGLTQLGAGSAASEQILTADAQAFLVQLHRRFAPRVSELLQRREQRRRELVAGALPDFLPETRAIREGGWKVAPIPADLLDRRVEITGPTDRKMIINALNSGAKVFMADCEDSLTPTWANVIDGQVNLRDAVNQSISLTSPEGKSYRLQDRVATLIVRPRGWHLYEKHLQVDGEQIPGAFVDFGLYLFHNANALRKRGTGAYFYLPKTESHLESRLWAEVFAFSEQTLDLPKGTIKVTVLIETILAAFEMDEILYELRDYIVGLNCGRWDYIFSFIKKFANRADFVLPERQQVTMTTHFLRSYSKLLIKTCHRRGAFAMGGMAAQIPIKNDPQANEQALAKVRADKEREASDGHDGTWVAHPALVAVAQEIFDRVMPQTNQLQRPIGDETFAAADLLAIPEGTISEAGLRNNIEVSLRYMAAWLTGLGCVPINNLMEDAATAEIARAQVWQWIRHPKGVLVDGRRITLAMFRSILSEEVAGISRQLDAAAFASGKFEAAAKLLDEITASEEFSEFLTLVAYRQVN